MASESLKSFKASSEDLKRARKYLGTFAKAPLRSEAIKYAPDLTPSEVLDVAREVLQLQLSPDSQGRYFLKCPGEAFHSGKTGSRDAQFLADGVPTLRCFHESCSHVIEELNREIRSQCGKAKVRNFSDDTARAIKAAEALLIGFALSSEDAESLLAEWGRSCDPQVSPADLSAALKRGKRSFDRAPSDSIGCLLQGRAMPSLSASSSPPRGGKLSEVSAAPSAPVASGSKAGVGIEEPIYIGPLGKLAKEIRYQIEQFEGDQGIKPMRVLVGTSFEGELPARICGLPAERWDRREHSVYG